MKDSKLTIRCESSTEEDYREICFKERKAYGDLLKDLIEFYKKIKNLEKVYAKEEK